MPQGRSMWPPRSGLTDFKRRKYVRKHRLRNRGRSLPARLFCCSLQRMPPLHRRRRTIPIRPSKSSQMLNRLHRR